MCLLLNVEVILSLATVLVVLQVLGTNIQYKTFGRVWIQDEIIPRWPEIFWHSVVEIMLELSNCTEVVINWLSSLSLAAPPVIDCNDNIKKKYEKVSEINWLFSFFLILGCTSSNGPLLLNNRQNSQFSNADYRNVILWIFGWFKLHDIR